MARTVTQAFTDFRINLEITTLQATTVSTRQANVRTNVSKRITLIEDFLTGSYVRSTMIAPLKDADVDIFVVLEGEDFQSAPNGPANVLDRLKRAIDNSYTETTEASRNSQAITIKFSDFKVDVVPAFSITAGGYYIPDPVEKTWIRTDPKTHVQLWSNANKFHEGRLVPFIKMIKAWNRAHSRRFRSFHLEAMVRQIFQNQKIVSYPNAALYFFENGCTNMYVNDPAGYGGNLAMYLPKDSAGLIPFTVAFQSATTKAKEAIAFNNASKNEEAIDKWRVIFGDYFPTYG